MGSSPLVSTKKKTRCRASGFLFGKCRVGQPMFKLPVKKKFVIGSDRRERIAGCDTSLKARWGFRAPESTQCKALGFLFGECRVGQPMFKLPVKKKPVIGSDQRERIEVCDTSLKARWGFRGPVFSSKSQTWHIIAARSVAYIISPKGCISSRLGVYFLRLDHIQHFVLIICKASP